VTSEAIRGAGITLAAEAPEASIDSLAAAAVALLAPKAPSPA
jgi:hypothetical protein